MNSGTCNSYKVTRGLATIKQQLFKLLATHLEVYSNLLTSYSQVACIFIALLDEACNFRANVSNSR